MTHTDLRQRDQGLSFATLTESSRKRPLSQPKERTQKVFDAIKAAKQNTVGDAFRTGDIIAHLRDGGFPLGIWEVRGEMTQLGKAGLIELDAASASWSLTQAGADTDKLSGLKH